MRVLLSHPVRQRSVRLTSLTTSATGVKFSALCILQKLAGLAAPNGR